MQATEDLFKLIKSLSKSEKRMFKLSAGRSRSGEMNNYLRLFEVIAAQEVYDEEGVKRQFVGEPLVNNFSVAKAYLYESILSSLRNSRSSLSADMELRRMLDHVELLHKRGLYLQAEKILKRGLRLARTQSLLPYESELLRWQRRLVNLTSGKDRYAVLAQLEQEEDLALGTLRQEARLRSIRAQVQSIFLNQVDLRKPEIADLLESLMSDSVMRTAPDLSHAGSFHALLAFHQIHAIHSRLMGLPHDTLGHYQSALEAWEKHPKIIRALPGQYLIALTNFLDSCMRAHEFKGFVETVSKIHNLHLKDPRLKARAFYLGNHLELRFGISTGQLAMALDREQVIEAGLKRHARYLSPGIELTFLFNLTVIHFLAADYNGAIQYANRILNRPSSPIRQDIVDGARLFELVSHFELENYDLLESLLRSMQRRLRTKPRTHAFEKVLLRGLRKLMAEPSSNRRVLFEALRDDFMGVEGAAYLVAREELLLWIKSKLEGRRMEALLVELARTKVQ